MKYLCVENQQLVSVLDYEPAVPKTVKVYTLDDSEFRSIEQGVKRFDPATGSLVDYNATQEIREQKESAEALAFLSSTDWQVLRHIRQRALGMDTSLTEVEYLDLEQQRHDASQRVRKA